ncbi:hypothetical protein MtrunA17_Chr4g0005441 [Medicago truncatula]|uniref:Transmembrane protein, putative n=1 Tax=Medicago truncatula TaxID=3880 RepID=G7JKP0_MEDTR|nr:transmembrane protein, putative [Medicago truncatula]RHN58727.1 hypothetical protein MtrunA17_Chr4g0005441 [Medicago truncatula]
MPNLEIQAEPIVGGGFRLLTIRDIIGQPEDGGGYWKRIIGMLGLLLRKILGIFAIFAYTDKEKWIDNMRGMLSVVATVIAIVSFQSFTNPIGGLLPLEKNSSICRFVGEYWICPVKPLSQR